MLIPRGPSWPVMGIPLPLQSLILQIRVHFEFNPLLAMPCVRGWDMEYNCTPLLEYADL